MTNQSSLDDRIRTFAKHFKPEEMVLCGGLAVYLATGFLRDTDDVDAIALNLGTAGMGRRIFDYQLEHRTKLDHTFPDNVFDSIDLSDPQLRERATIVKQYKSGETVCYLGAEALIATKLTSLCISCDPNQTRYGVKVLRDKDLDDVRNLLKNNVDRELVLDILGTVPHLEEVDLSTFYDGILRVMNESGAPISFIKNAYGVARYIAHPQVEDKGRAYSDLLDKSHQHQTAEFSLLLDQLFHDVYS